MQQYLNLLKEIKSKGTWKDAAREGMPRTLSLFGAQSRYDLSEGFPLVTTKKVSFKNVVTELLWFLRGDTNIKYLLDNDCNIWNEDAYNYYLNRCKRYDNKPMLLEDFIKAVKEVNYKETYGYTLGDCGEQYGKLWRAWKDPQYDGGEGWDDYIDQIANLIEGLKSNPIGRRHVVSAWNPATLDDMALNACHAMFQMNCRALTKNQKYEWINYNREKISVPIDLSNDNPSKDLGIVHSLDVKNVPKYYLDCHMYQRSADVFLGVPYNIASYALLIHFIAGICNMIPGDLIISYGDVHIYENHMDQVDEQLTREPKKLPKLRLRPWNLHDLEDPLSLIKTFTVDNFLLEGYDPHSAIKGKLSTGLK